MSLDKYLGSLGLQGYDQARADPPRYNSTSNTLLLTCRKAGAGPERICFLKQGDEDKFRKLELQDKESSIIDVITPQSSAQAYLLVARRVVVTLQRLSGMPSDRFPDQLTSVGHGYGRVFKMDLPRGQPVEVATLSHFPVVRLFGCSDDGRTLFMSIASEKDKTRVKMTLSRVDVTSGSVESLLIHKVSLEWT